MDTVISHYSKFKCPRYREKFKDDILIEDLHSVSYEVRRLVIEIQYGFSSGVVCPNCRHQWLIKGNV
ncbi:hypothetical protein [Exiguobacterium acetylicum]|uniref:hypothetical protein n=1 Tax=Exiguobacterium acetylicum TaxID=41170 RepID=UPI000681E34E|nr:hypothetical protein [Exiguobacterium acetylicum]KNH31059.1 hypothetical protein ACS74_16190 [Exiguobacterium acetylicum]